MSCFKSRSSKNDGSIQNKSHNKPEWYRQFFAELFGTFFIVAIGDGAIANYLLNKNNKLGVDHFAVCFAFGIGALIGISTSAPISGAHLNPAVTIALATLRKFPTKKIPLYLLAQYLGSFLAAFAIFGAYYEAIDAYDSGSRTAYYDIIDTNYTFKQTNTGPVFATYPASYVTLIGSLLDQIVATFMLMFAVLAITDEKGINTPKHLQPLILALVITGICIAFGLNCGAVLNPARDFAPRLFTALVGYGLQPFRPIQSLYWLSAGIIGPHLGAIIGAFAYKLTIFYNQPTLEDNNDYNIIGLCDSKQESYKTKVGNNNLIEDSDKLQPFIMRETEQNNRNANYHNSCNPIVNDNMDSNVHIVNPNNPNIASDGTKNWYEINDSSITILSTPKQIHSKSMSSLDSLSDSEKINDMKNY